MQLTEALTYKVSLCTKINLRLNHTTGCLSGARVRHSDMTSDLGTARPTMLKTRLRDNARGKWREGERNKPTGKRQRRKKKYTKTEKSSNEERERWRALGASHQSINVESNGLAN